jgi:hypothetical protein
MNNTPDLRGSHRLPSGDVLRIDFGIPRHHVSSLYVSNQNTSSSSAILCFYLSATTWTSTPPVIAPLSTSPSCLLCPLPHLSRPRSTIRPCSASHLGGLQCFQTTSIPFRSSTRSSRHPHIIQCFYSAHASLLGYISIFVSFTSQATPI